MLPTKFKSVSILIQENKLKMNFQDGGFGGHLRFPIETLLPNFDFTGHPDGAYPVSSQVAFLFRSRSTKLIFNVAPLRPSWMSDQNDFSFFLI